MGPTWGEILKELAESQKIHGTPQLDHVRRKYMVLLQQETGRAVILYSSKWTQPDANVAPGLVSIVDEDLQGLMEVIHGVKEEKLDLILHSPGGSLEAAEALVLYLRSKFTHIRVIVPQLAMSAAAMIACAADEIVLGKHSFLGPTDPQFILNTPVGAAWFRPRPSSSNSVRPKPNVVTRPNSARGCRCSISMAPTCS